MTTLREAAQQALEALEWFKQRGLFGDFYGVADTLRDALAEPNRAQKLTEAGYTRRPTLREMAEPEYPLGKATTDVGVPVYVVKKAEPVQEQAALAWSNLEGTKFVGNGEKWKHKDCVVPLYTAPSASVSEAPQRKPLSEDEIFAIENDIPDDVISDRAWTICFARAVEAAHGIKEGT